MSIAGTDPCSYIRCADASGSVPQNSAVFIADTKSCSSICCAVASEHTPENSVVQLYGTPKHWSLALSSFTFVQINAIGKNNCVQEPIVIVCRCTYTAIRIIFEKYIIPKDSLLFFQC